MVNVVVPFTHIEPATRAALDASGRPWEPVDVSGDDTAYWSLFDRLWRAGETFVIVEHDVVVRPDSIDELEQCPEKWCGFAHEYLTSSYYGLGCIKFSAQLIAEVPDLIEVIAPYEDDLHPPMHWCRLDMWIRRTLANVGVGFHKHRPELGHSHMRPSHGCLEV